MPVPSLIAIGRFHKAKRARLYAEEEVIILIVLASWLNMLLLIT
jgi:hypothetical protein